MTPQDIFTLIGGADGARLQERAATKEKQPRKAAHAAKERRSQHEEEAALRLARAW